VTVHALPGAGPAGTSARRTATPGPSRRSRSRLRGSGRKLLALFDRAAARDFADVRLLARRFGKDVLLARAAQIDPGFDIGTLAGMIATLDRFADDEIPVPEGSSVAELRAFYAEWRSELMNLSEG
jgi:hypothetical protein